MRRRQPIYNNTLPIVKKRLYCLSLLMTGRERQSSDSSLVATFTTALLTAPSVPSRNESLMMSPTETTRFPIIALTAKFVSSVRSHGERRLDRSRKKEGGRMSQSCEWKWMHFTADLHRRCLRIDCKNTAVEGRIQYKLDWLAISMVSILVSFVSILSNAVEIGQLN